MTMEKQGNPVWQNKFRENPNLDLSVTSAVNLWVIGGADTSAASLVEQIDGMVSRAKINRTRGIKPGDDAIPTAPVDGIFICQGHGAADAVAQCVVLSADPRFKKVPVILVSLREYSEEWARFAVERGADDILVSPLKSHELLAKLRWVQRLSRSNARSINLRDRHCDYLDRTEFLFVVLNFEGKIRQINKYAARAIGYEPEELIGVNWDERFSNGGSFQNIEEIAHCLHTDRENQKSRYVRATLNAKSGAVLDVIWRNAPLVQDDGRVTGLFFIGQFLSNIEDALGTTQIALPGDVCSRLVEAGNRLVNALNCPINAETRPQLESVNLQLQEVLKTIPNYER